MKLCVVAGEASGDLHGADAVRELRKLDPELVAFGIGGDELAASGVELLHHVRDLAIVGLFNVIRHLPMYRRVFRELMTRIEQERPDAILLIDFPDFNLRIAKALQKLDIPMLYYISPQVWAWRSGRIRQIARTVDHMMVVFPFEKLLYEGKMRATWVGHPLVEQLEHLVPPRSRPLPEGKVRLAILPGSRLMEIEELLPEMMRALDLFRAGREVEAFIIKAPTISREQLEAAAPGCTLAVELVSSEGRKALASADLAIVSSGTATLEAAILGVPCVVMYRLPRLTWFVARRIVRLENVSLVNIVAGSGLVPELLQRDATGERAVQELERLLEPDQWKKVTTGLRSVYEKLGGERPAANVARIIIEESRK